MPWFSFGSGPDKVGEFVGKMADSASAGWGAQALDKLGVAQGPSGQTVSQQINSAGKDIGPVASGLADAAGYMAGPGKLALGEKIGAKLGSGLLARMGGAAAENAGASVAGTMGHGDYDVGDNLKALAFGGVTGAAGGALTRGARAGDVSPTAGLEADASSLYAPLNKTQYPTPAVERVLNKVSVPQGMQANISNKLSDQIDRVQSIVAQGGKTTASDIAGFRRSLLNAATNDTDMKIAGQYVSALENGVGPQMTAKIAEANAASNTAKTSADIDDWITQLKRDPGKVPDAVNSAITNSPGFYKGVMPQLQDVANSKPGIWSKVADKAVGTVGGALIDATANYMGGGSPLSGALAGGATGLLLGHGAGQLRAGNLSDKLAAARHFNATGEKLPPSAFSQGFGPLSTGVGYGRQALAGLGASGMFAQSP